MSRRLIVITLLVAAAAACIWFVRTREHSEPPQFSAQTPVSIEVIVGDESVATITNTLGLMSLLRNGKWKPPHPCIARGQFIIRYSADDAVRVSFYPGHADSNYEFAVGGKGYIVARKH